MRYALNRGVARLPKILRDPWTWAVIALILSPLWIWFIWTNLGNITSPVEIARAIPDGNGYKIEMKGGLFILLFLFIAAGRSSK